MPRRTRVVYVWLCQVRFSVVSGFGQESDVPLDYKSATIKMSAQRVRNSLDSANFRLTCETELTVDKRAVKVSIDALRGKSRGRETERSKGQR